ncbi:MAG: Ig-like domain-containing protein, partial [Planctomycetota bacterium]
PSGIDLDLRQNKIYWVDSDPAGDRMRYAFLDGTLLQSVKDNVGDAVAIDDAVSVAVKDGSGEVFWIEPVSNQITLESAGATTLVAKGSTGLVDIEYVSLDANQAPVADIGGTYNVIEGQSVSLDASASSDADGSIVSYEWDFNFDGATFDVDASGAIVSFSATGLDGPTTRSIGLRVTDNQGSASLTKSVVVVANGAPVAVDDVVATDEDTAIDIFPLLNDFDPSALDTLSLSTPLLSTMTSKLVSGPATRSVSIVGDTIRFNPGTDFNDLQAGDSENVVMTYQVRDDDGGVDSGTITITVFGKNDAPSLVDGASVSLPAINEDDTNAAGLSIASLLSDAGLGADDADAGTVLGVAVTAADDSHGSWQFSRDAGITWTTFGSVSSSSATLLDDNAQVRFVPQAEYSGTAGALRFRAWDQSAGASGDQGVDLTSAGAAGAFSQETAEATLNVLPVNDAPLAQADSLVTQEDVPIRITKSLLLANDVDVDGDTLTLTIDTPPGQGTWIDNGDDSFTFTPTRHFHGLTTLTYRVTDPDGLSHTATATITVVPENDRPTAVDDFFATQEDVSLNFDPTQLMSNDADVDGDPLNLTLLSQPDKGLVTTNLDGSFTFTPFANAEGVTSFQYRITDTDGLSATATVQITIQPLNDAPQTADDTYGVLEDGTLLGASVLANDFDVDGDALTAELVAGPAAGTLTLRADGTFTYVHAGGEAASDSFRYQARDASGVTTQAQVTIQVTNVNDQPLAMDDHFQVAEGDRHIAAGTLSALANDVDPDSPTLSGLVKTGPRHGTLNWNADGTFVYVHDGSETLSDSFSYTVSDGSSGTDEGVVQIDVTPVNDAPVATNDSLSVAANTGEIVFVSSELLGNDYDAEGQATQIVLLEAPLHGTVTLQPDGNISYEADVNFSGVDSFRYAISDGEAQSSPATVAVLVTPALPARNTVTPIVTTTTTTAVRAPSATIETAVTAVDAEPSLTLTASPAAPTPPSSTSTPASTSSIPTTTSTSDTAAPQTPFPSILPFTQAESEDDDEAMFFGAEASRKSEDIVTVEQLREVITAANEIVPAPVVTRGNLPVQASAPQSGQPAGQYQPRTLPNEQLALASEAQFLRVASSFEASIIQSTEAMRDELPYTTTSVIDECAFAATSTFSVGYVLWMLRGGYLFATVISSMPAWQNFDPVPIMAYANVGRDGEDESLETLMEKSPPTT